MSESKALVTTERMTAERMEQIRGIGERTGYFTQAERLEIFAELDRARVAELALRFNLVAVSEELEHEREERKVRAVALTSVLQEVTRLEKALRALEAP